MPNLEHALDLAHRAHAGQKDRYGAPFILHPLRVMMRLQTEPEKIAGILHDLVEKTEVTLQDLRDAGYPDEIVEAVDALSRREGESYEDLVHRSAANSLARRVKVADLEDNMDLRRMPEVRTDDVERLNRYLQAWQRLTGENG